MRDDPGSKKVTRSFVKISYRNNKMSYAKFIARLSHSSLEFIKKTYNLMDAVLSGIWLGVMSEKSLDIYDEMHYNNSEKYTDDNYNLSGLFEWEKERIEKYFLKSKKVLLLGAGGGRETVALFRMGYNVDSFECNMGLVEYGNIFLKKYTKDYKIKYLQKDSVPSVIMKYDGIIIGWGAYSHIRGFEKRIAFLKKLQPFLNKDAPLMISFLTNEEKGRQEKITKKVSDFFRFLRNKDKIEPGDKLQASFVHYFTKQEIIKELTQSNYKVLDYYDIDYGCAISLVN